MPFQDAVMPAMVKKFFKLFGQHALKCWAIIRGSQTEVFHMGEAMPALDFQFLKFDN
jgi:hypothetical protein